MASGKLGEFEERNAVEDSLGAAMQSLVSVVLSTFTKYFIVRQTAVWSVKKVSSKMPTSKPINLQVSDIVNWFRKKELVINEVFQRHSVWTTTAKTFLIDTILNELPIPKIYLRTTIDAKKQTAVREIVDGQQRVRTLVDFANNKLKLTSRSKDFSGLLYEDLDETTQQKFLGYTLTAEQLLNADDDDVIDIFARLNSYTVPLNAAEKRHAEFQSEFKFAVRAASQQFRGFIEKYDIFSTKQRFRMADDSFFAEVFGVLLEGVCDGGESNIRRLYLRQHDEVFSEDDGKAIRKKIKLVLDFLDQDLGDTLHDDFSKHYQVLMMIAAYAHHKWGIPAGDIKPLPERCGIAQAASIKDKLSALGDAMQMEEPPKRYEPFVEASASSTHRIASRRVRFKFMVDAFGQ